MRVRIDARIRADHRVLADLDATSVVQVRSLPDHNAVSDREVVPKGKVHAVVDLHFFPQVIEDVPSQHASEPQP